MPISPDAMQMSQMQGQQDPQKLMMLLAMLAQQSATPPGAQMAQPQSPGIGQQAGAMLGGQGAMGGPPTLGMNQPIPMQMPNPDPQGKQQQPPLPPDPMGLQ